MGRRGPGLLFTDRINRDNPLPSLGRIEATNWCGEVPLMPYESCNLGSLNLVRFVAGGRVDFAGLRSAVRLAVRFLDDVIDVNRYWVPELEGPAQAARWPPRLAGSAVPDPAHRGRRLPAARRRAQAAPGPG